MSPTDRGFNTSTRRSRLPSNWTTIRERILHRDHHTCQQCGNRATQVDHIRAGDDHHDDNLQALCTTCHARKTGREGAAARHAIPTDRPKETHPGLKGGGPPPPPA